MSDVTVFAPRRVIILEGILLLTDSRLRELMDALHLHGHPLDICFAAPPGARRAERGRTMDSCSSSIRRRVRPMFMQFIDPSKQYADVIVPRRQEPHRHRHAQGAYPPHADWLRENKPGDARLFK